MNSDLIFWISYQFLLMWYVEECSRTSTSEFRFDFHIGGRTALYVTVPVMSHLHYALKGAAGPANLLPAATPNNIVHTHTIIIIAGRDYSTAAAER